MKTIRLNIGVVATWAVLVMPIDAKGGDPYDILLSNPRITSAIETNPYIEPGTYMDFLLMKIDQLETWQTQSWSDYRHPSPHTDQEIAEVILQKVALSLYVEANGLVPWSLFDYDDESLRIVLGDAYTELSSSPFWEVRVLFNLNPLVPFAWGNQLRSVYPDHPIKTRKDLLDLTIIKMRDDRWVHVGSGFDDAQACAQIGWLGFIDFECLELTKLGSSGITPSFIYSVLHAQNVPSRKVFWFGHGGIEFPSLGLAMDGDGVYHTMYAGLALKPNYLPVDFSYLELPVFEQWMAMERCDGVSLLKRHNSLQYVSLLDDPEWNADILAAYCLRASPEFTGPWYVPGDYVRSLLNGGRHTSCQNDDPEGENYQAPALTDEELDEWMAAVAELATDCGPCTTDTDCDDGDWCDGEDWCDSLGYCRPVKRAMLCDDGLPCGWPSRCGGEPACNNACTVNGICKQVVDAPDCDDGLMCTLDRCADNACTYTPADYGDANEDGVVDLRDILCVLDGFGGQFNCPPESIDIANCTADGTIDVSDILAILDAFAGDDPCCGS